VIGYQIEHSLVFAPFTAFYFRGQANKNVDNFLGYID